MDAFGFDREVTEQFLLTALRPIARKWFRVDVRGAENIPADGGALVVSNHSGTVPVDGLMTMVSVHDHTAGSCVRWAPTSSSGSRSSATSPARAAPPSPATRTPSGCCAAASSSGSGRRASRASASRSASATSCQRFGRGGFVSAAIRPASRSSRPLSSGAEEIYSAGRQHPLPRPSARRPYIPITPLFPLLGPLGLIPLPSKWLIEFGEPIRTDDYDEGAADDPMLVFNVTDQVRESIQQTLYTLLMQRKSVFS